MRAAARLSWIAVLAGTVVSALPAAAQHDRIGSEFQVNTFTPGYQNHADVAADAQGNFVAVWDGPATSSIARTVFVQRFDRDGTALGTEYEVPTGTCSPPRFAPAMCRDSAGRGVLAWSMGDGFGGPANGVFTQLFDSGGNLLGTEFQVNSQPPAGAHVSGVSIACGDAGDFVVVWSDYASGSGRSPYGVLGRRFDSTGAPEGSEFQVNTYTSTSFANPKVAADDDRDFVVVWTGYDGGGAEIFGRRFASDGTFLGTEFQVNSYSPGSQIEPSVASDGTGDFVVAWSDLSVLDGFNSGIFAQRFASTGAFLGTEFQVNSYTILDQIRPSVASDATGDFVIAWRGAYKQDGSELGNLRAALRRRRSVPGNRVPGQYLHDGEPVRGFRRLRRPWQLPRRLEQLRPRRQQYGGLRPALRQRRESGRKRVPGQHVHRRIPVPSRPGGGRLQRLGELRRHLARAGDDVADQSDRVPAAL